MHNLLRKAQTIAHLPKTESDSTPKKTTNTRMAKLKFPTFSCDLRDYRRFKELFTHFSLHLDHTERFYQMVESMERNSDKNKVKVCINIKKAWAVLDIVYGDEDRLVETLFTDLEQMNSYGLKGNPVDLDSLEEFVESLQNFTSQIVNGNEGRSERQNALVTRTS